MVAYVLEVGGVDVADLVDPKSLVLKHTVAGDISPFSFTIDDEEGTLAPANEQLVRLTQDGQKHFEGLLRILGKTDSGLSTQKVYDVSCQDYTSRLDDDLVDVGYRDAVESDKARISWLFATFGSHGIVAGSSVIQLKATMPPQDFTGMSLHQALAEIAKITGARQIYVDFDKNLHYFATEVLSAPFGLSDNPNFTTTFPYQSFRLPSNSVATVNEVHVHGKDLLVKRYKGGVPPAAGTRRARPIRDETILDVATAEAAGDAYLAEHSDPSQPGSLTTYQPGLRAGMTVQVTHSGHGLAATTFLIQSVEARPDTKERISHVVQFGSKPVRLADFISPMVGSIASLQRAVAGVEANIADLSIGGGNLVPNSSFEDGTAWTVGAGWAIGFDPTPPEEAFAGVKVARLVLAAAVAGPLRTPYIVVDRTDSYWCSAPRFVRSISSGQLRMIVEEYDVASTLLRTTVVGSATAIDAEWADPPWAVHFDNTGDALGRIAWLASTVKIRVGFDSAGAAATLTADIDGVQVERNDFRTAYAPTPRELLNAPIGTTQITDLSITTDKLAARAAVFGKIGVAAIGAEEIQALAINANHMNAGSVEVGHMADPISAQLVPNPSFEDTSGIAVGSVSQPIPGWQSLVYARIVGTPTDGGLYALELAGNGTNRDIRSDFSPVMAGRLARFRVRARGNAGNDAASAVHAAIEMYDADLALLSTLGGTTLVVGAGTAYVDVAVPDLTIPAGASFIRVLLRCTSATPAGSEVHFDNLSGVYLDLDLVHGGGKVRIGPFGIQISDRFDSSSLDAGGFTGSWLSFIKRGFYNADFGDGSTSDIPVSIVSGADSLADYDASLTALLPYWIVETSGGTLKKVVDADGSSGFALEATGTECIIFQDVPILPGFHYLIAANCRGGNISDNFLLRGASWRDATHALIGSASTTDVNFRLLVGTAYAQRTATTKDAVLPVAPSKARFLRVRLSLTGGTLIRLTDIEIQPLRVQRAADFADLTLSSDYTVPFALDEITDLAIDITPAYDCEIEIQTELDVSVTSAGTGVCTFRWQYFDPVGLTWNDIGQSNLTGAFVNRATIPLTVRQVLNGGQAEQLRLVTAKTVNGGAAVITALHTRCRYTLELV